MKLKYMQRMLFSIIIACAAFACSQGDKNKPVNYLPMLLNDPAKGALSLVLQSSSAAESSLLSRRASMFPDAAIKTYDITGAFAGPSADTFSLLNTPVNGLVTVPNLRPGNWTITVVGKNAIGVAVQHGVKTVAIVAGLVAEVTIDLVKMEGNGTFTMSIYWPNEFNTFHVEGRIEGTAGTTPLNFVNAGAPETIDGALYAKASVSQTDVAAGHYKFTFELRDGSTTIITGNPDSVYVQGGLTTEGKRVIKRTSASGNFYIAIEPQKQKYLVITMNGQRERIEERKGMTVVARTFIGNTEDKTVAYQWYLDGAALTGATNYYATVGNDQAHPLSIGTHSLTVFVEKTIGAERIYGASEVQFEVVAEGSLQASCDQGGAELVIGKNYTGVLAAYTPDWYTITNARQNEEFEIHLDESPYGSGYFSAGIKLSAWYCDNGALKKIPFIQGDPEGSNAYNIDERLVFRVPAAANVYLKVEGVHESLSGTYGMIVNRWNKYYLYRSFMLWSGVQQPGRYYYTLGGVAGDSAGNVYLLDLGTNCVYQASDTKGSKIKKYAANGDFLNEWRFFVQGVRWKEQVFVADENAAYLAGITQDGSHVLYRVFLHANGSTAIEEIYRTPDELLSLAPYQGGVLFLHSPRNDKAMWSVHYYKNGQVQLMFDYHKFNWRTIATIIMSDAGNVYVFDPYEGIIQKVLPIGSNQSWHFDNGAYAVTCVNNVFIMARADSNGQHFFYSYSITNNGVLDSYSTGNVITKHITAGPGPNGSIIEFTNYGAKKAGSHVYYGERDTIYSLRNIRNIEFCPDGIYFLSYDKILKYTDASGSTELTTTGPGNPGIINPAQFDFDSTGNIYVVDYNADRTRSAIKKFSPAGEFIRTWDVITVNGAPYTLKPARVSLDDSGKMYAFEPVDNADQYTFRILTFNANGDYTGIFANGQHFYNEPYSNEQYQYLRQVTVMRDGSVVQVISDDINKTSNGLIATITIYAPDGSIVKNINYSRGPGFLLNKLRATDWYGWVDEYYRFMNIDPRGGIYASHFNTFFSGPVRELNNDANLNTIVIDLYDSIQPHSCNKIQMVKRGSQNRLYVWGMVDDQRGYDEGRIYEFYQRY